MAIVNDPRLYSGGSAVFNSQPATQFYLQSEARRRAKDEALDNYYRDFNKSLNPAGMRNQDIEGWMGKVNDWRGFYQQNKEAIKNPRLDNGRAQSEYMSRYQDALSDVQRSKNAGEISKGYVMPVVTNPDKRSRLTDFSLGTIASHDASIYDPNHKELDPTQLDFDAKPFDLNKFTNNLTRGLKMDKAVQKISVDPKTHSETISYDYDYSPEALRVIGDRAADNYDNDESMQQHIEQVKQDDKLFDQYNALFRSVYNRDIINDKDFAAAYGLNKVQMKRQEDAVRGYNPFLGMGGWGNKDADKFNYGVTMTNALRTGNTNDINSLFNLLRSGKGNTTLHDGFVVNEGGQPFVYFQIKDKAPYGETDVYTKKFAVNDPALPDFLTKLYQDIMGADATQEKLQYRPSRAEVVAPSGATPAPKPKAKTETKTSTKKSDPLGIL